MGLETPVAASRLQRLTLGQLLRTVVALFKLRIVALLLFSAVSGAFLGADGLPSVDALLTVLITGALAAGGASAVNQYLEQKSDAQMRRTQHRPLASGQLGRPVAVPWIAVVMITAAVLSVLPTNALMAFYLALGALIYVGVYTIWLKPRSVVNIVIGGTAGSCAVMTGGAAVGAASEPGVVALALLIFLWTPMHFWALAMFYKEDYAAADIPMLPVRAPAKQATIWIFLHAISTGIAAVVLAVHPMLGWPYLVPTGAITLFMLLKSIQLLRNPDRKYALRLFVVSNIFLACVFLAIILASVGHRLIFT